MPGLIGAIQKAPAKELRPLFKRLLGSMQHNDRLHHEMSIASDAKWALGRVHLNIFQPGSQLGEKSQLQVLFHGELYNHDDLKKSLQEQGIFNLDNKDTSLIAACYRHYGPSFPSRLKGSFCTAILDEKKKKLLIASDTLGSYPLYWVNGSQRFIFASELKTVLCDPTIKPVLDPRAVADYLTFGFIFGDKTLAEQARLLPPASVLTYCWEKDDCTLERYARLDAAFRPWEGTRSQYFEALGDAFHRAVQRMTVDEHHFALALSGGLDSRTVLSVIDTSRAPISTYTLGAKGCADEVIAKELSRIVGTQHHFFELNEQYLDKFLTYFRQMINLTDGMYLSHGLTEMLALQALEQANFSILLRGHGGELAKTQLAWPFHTDKRVHHMSSKDEFIPYILQRANYISHEVSLNKLFTSEWFDLIDGAPQASLEASITDVDLPPMDLCSYLYVDGLHRRFTGASLELFRSRFEIKLPFADVDFLGVLFRGPSCWRESTAIHKAIIDANHTALLRVRNSNTGAPAGAGALLESIYDKMNSLFKKLNLYGYRHYHNFELWMKQKLIESVEAVLLASDNKSQGMYRATTLRRLLDETKHGRANHGYLLQILLILELWQQENL